MLAVYRQHDYFGQAIPLAVHRVQVLQSVRKFGQRREFCFAYLLLQHI